MVDADAGVAVEVEVGAGADAGAGGVFFAIANVICVSILAWAYLSVKLETKALAVTGSARTQNGSNHQRYSGSELSDLMASRIS